MSTFSTNLNGSRYRLLGLVGQGQFGRVYCASHRKTGQLVALKELDRQRFSTQKFLRELRFLTSLRHENIVTCQALEHTRSGRYLVMDYCEGGTLRSLMQDDVRLHPLYCLKLVSDVLAGLDHAHNRQVIHCDIKPENILLTLIPGGWIARISDFGIARLHQELTTGESTNMGSPAYMAPERFYGQYSYASDLYAVGVLLFELLTGYRPFSGSPLELMSAHLNQPVKLPETIPRPLRSIVTIALQKLQARRFRSAREMLAAVERAVEDLQLTLRKTRIESALLKPTSSLPVQACDSLNQEPLWAEVRQLVALTKPKPRDAQESASEQDANRAVNCDYPEGGTASHHVYRVCKRYVACQIFPAGILTDHPAPTPAPAPSILRLLLPDVVQRILVGPQGCYAMTRRDIYRIPSEPVLEAALQKRQQSQEFGQSFLDQYPTPQRVVEVEHDFLATIDPQGRWLATATAEGNGSKLSIWKLPWKQHPEPSGYLSLHQQIVRLQHQALQLLTIDSNHIGMLSTRLTLQPGSGSSATILDIFARRGQLVGSLELPISIRQAINSSLSYRLLAVESEHPASIVLMDLKPFRLQRIGVEIQPVLLTATTWGYVLADAAGDIALLDQSGHTIGRIRGPANPTAIAVVEPYGLLIATWSGRCGNLHVVDLRQVELEMVF